MKLDKNLLFLSNHHILVHFVFITILSRTFTSTECFFPYLVRTEKVHAATQVPPRILPQSSGSGQKTEKETAKQRLKLRQGDKGTYHTLLSIVKIETYFFEK